MTNFGNYNHNFNLTLNLKIYVMIKPSYTSIDLKTPSTQ